MMKRLLIALIVLQAAACGTRPVHSESDDVRELTQLENSVGVASTTGDSVFLDWVMDPRFVMTLEDGRKLSREELIARWTATDPTTSAPSFQMDDLEVLVEGHSATVNAVTTERWSAAGVEHVYRERILDVWRRTPSGWRWISSKPSKLDSAE